MNEFYKCIDHLFSMTNKTWLLSIYLVFQHW